MWRPVRAAFRAPVARRLTPVVAAFASDRESFIAIIVIDYSRPRHPRRSRLAPRRSNVRRLDLRRLHSPASATSPTPPASPAPAGVTPAGPAPVGVAPAGPAPAGSARPPSPSSRRAAPSTSRAIRLITCPPAIASSAPRGRSVQSSACASSGPREERLRVRAPIHRSSIGCHRFAPSGRGVAAPVVLPVAAPTSSPPLRRPHGLQRRGALSTPPPRGRPRGCTDPRAAVASPHRAVASAARGPCNRPEVFPAVAPDTRTAAASPLRAVAPRHAVHSAVPAR
jgi:hypothetical protein